MGDIPWIFHALITTCQLGCTPSWPLPLSFSRDASAPPSRNSNSTCHLPCQNPADTVTAFTVQRETDLSRLIWCIFYIHIIYILNKYIYICIYICIYVYIYIYMLMIHDDPWWSIFKQQSGASSWIINILVKADPFHKSSFEFMSKKCIKTVASQKVIKKVHDCNCFLVHLHWGLKMV